MKNKFIQLIAVITAFVFVFLKPFTVAAHDYQNSPEDTNHMVDMVFSVAKVENDDLTSTGNRFDGQKVSNYYQIHADITKSGDANRYAVPVSGSAVVIAIDNVLNNLETNNVYENTKNLNEIELLKELDVDEEQIRSLVENVLLEVLGEAEYYKVCDLAFQYMNNKINSENDWYIDWYVIKYQWDGRPHGRIHIDGAITYYPVEPEVEPDITPEITPAEEPIITEEPGEPDPEVTPEITEEPTPEITTAPTPRIIIPPIIIITPEITPTEVPTEVLTSTPEPTVAPTEEPAPTQEPEPTPAEEVEVIPVETPEGTPDEEIDIDPPAETPEGAPEEEIEVEPIDIPEGLPQTGVPGYVFFFSIGSLLVALGTIIVKRK